MTPMFSVVVPVFNVAPYLNASLESLCTATEQLKLKHDGSVEIICVDDGSTDESGSILDCYALAKPRLFKVIHQQNKGLGPTRNVGINIAKGEWLCFVDSDDEVTPDYLTTLWELIRHHRPDCIRFGHVEVPTLGCNTDICNGNILIIDPESKPCSVFDFISSAFAWNTAYQRNIVGDVRYEAITPGEDVLFSCAMLPRIRRLAVTDAPIYHYLQRPESLAHKKEISLRQIESCGISTIGRIDHIKSWDHFDQVKHPLYKMVRTTFIGQVGLLLQRVRAEDKAQAWHIYCDYGKRIFANGKGFIPRIQRQLAIMVFKHESRFLWRLLLFEPWRGRVALLGCKAIRRARDLIRR